MSKEPKPKLVDVLIQIRLICTIYEGSTTKVERIMQYTAEIQRKLGKTIKKEGE